MNSSSRSTQVFQDKSALLHEGKKFASNLYEQSKEAINDVEDNVKEYSEKIVEGVKHYPFTTALIVGGISVLITLLLRKH